MGFVFSQIIFTQYLGHKTCCKEKKISKLTTNGIDGGPVHSIDQVTTYQVSGAVKTVSAVDSDQGVVFSPGEVLVHMADELLDYVLAAVDLVSRAVYFSAKCITYTKKGVTDMYSTSWSLHSALL